MSASIGRGFPGDFPGYKITKHSLKITSDGSFEITSAMLGLRAFALGGGGGGGMILSAGAEAGGGGGGALALATLPPYAEGTILTLGIGVGGAGRSGSTGTGNPGGTTSVAIPTGETVVSASGGAGGGAGGPPGAGGSGGSSVSPSGYSGLEGENGQVDGNDFGGDGANSIWRKVDPDADYLGGLGGIVNNDDGDPPAAGVYGAGGGGGVGAGVGGNGSAGIVLMTWMTIEKVSL